MPLYSSSAMTLSLPLLLNVLLLLLLVTNFIFLLTALGPPLLSIKLLMERIPFLSTWLAIEVALGVREWYLLGRSLTSGGLES